MSLVETFNQLVEKTLKEDTLTMLEDPRLQVLLQNGIYSHSQPMPEDDEMTETVEEKRIIQEIDQQVPEKKQNLSENDKIVNRHRIRYTATRIKYSPTRTKSRNFLSNTSYTDEVYETKEEKEMTKKKKKWKSKLKNETLNDAEVRAKKRKEQATERETEMWKRQNGLNGQFKKIDESKKEANVNKPQLIRK